MLKIDIIDGKNTKKARDLWLRDLDHSIQQMLKTSYPESQMDDFITYKNLSQYCMDYLGQIIERANDKTKPLNSRWQVSCPKASAPLTLKTAWQPAIPSVSGWRILLRFGGSWTLLLASSWWWLFGCWINVLHPFGWNFDPYPFILLNLTLSMIAAIQAPLIMMSQNRAADYDRLQSAEMTLMSIWSLKEKFAYCIRKLTIWCNKTRRIYWKFKSCKPNCWCPCLIMWPNCVKN